MDDEYFTCANCHDTFKRGWSDAEAMDEMLDTFPPEHFAEDPSDPIERVCDDCYESIMARIRTEAPHLLRPEAR